MNFAEMTIKLFSSPSGQLRARRADWPKGVFLAKANRQNLLDRFILVVMSKKEWVAEIGYQPAPSDIAASDWKVTS